MATHPKGTIPRPRFSLNPTNQNLSTTSLSSTLISPPLSHILIHASFPGKDKNVDLLMEGSEADGGLVTKKYDCVWMNERWMDIGLTGMAIQYNKEEGTRALSETGRTGRNM